MKRSKHSLSHYRLTSLNMGELYPVCVQEVLPGDSFRHQTSALLRVSPLVAPVMHPVHLMVHHWYVPNRLIWDNWEAFITGRDPALVVPTVTMTKAYAVGWRFTQAMEVGVDNATNITVNALPFRAYNTIWNEFYRDQDLNAKIAEFRGDSGDVEAGYQVMKASWEKDYFTTARPYPQQGAATEVTNLTLSGTVPVIGIGKNDNVFGAGVTARESTGSTRAYAAASYVSGSAPGNSAFHVEQGVAGFPNIRVDLANVAAGQVKMDINEWRKSMAMQRMREHRNRFGSRYKDMLAFLGVQSSDSRLDRPEYLGGGKQTISFSEVLSTAETTGAVVGEMAGHGIAALRCRPYKRFFEEHGYVISVICARPVSVYPTRVPRHYLRRDYEHYWQKELEIMGEQPITNAEIYGDAAAPSGVFGYIPRYDEYRHGESYVSGEFRSLLDYWHLGRKFAAQPVLNGTFVSCDPATRIYASAVTEQLYAMISHRISARRLVSKRARA